jgi:hypothetical protein
MESSDRHECHSNVLFVGHTHTHLQKRAEEKVALLYELHFCQQSSTKEEGTSNK